jgi:hypothetical protein
MRRMSGLWIWCSYGDFLKSFLTYSELKSDKISGSKFCYTGLYNEVCIQYSWIQQMKKGFDLFHVLWPNEELLSNSGLFVNVAHMPNVSNSGRVFSFDIALSSCLCTCQYGYTLLVFCSHCSLQYMCHPISVSVFWFCKPHHPYESDNCTMTNIMFIQISN